MKKTKVTKAECFEFRPPDRDYNKHGGKRDAKPEILGGGLSYAIRTAIVYGVLIWEEEEDERTESD